MVSQKTGDMIKNYLLFIFLFCAAFLCADYPQVNVLDNSDIIFKQFSSDIDLSYRNYASSKKNIPLLISRYKRKNEDLFSFSSRVNLPYESIATLNRIAKPSDFINLDTVLIPNQPCIFIPDNALNDLELFLSTRKLKGNKITVSLNNKIEMFYMIRNGRLNSTERSLFLNTFFRFPINRGRISSYYGSRPHPFTGKMSFHNGIDIAASVGTDVFASASGKVSSVDYDPVLGNYLVIEHSGGFYTIYGHLSKTLVLLNTIVKTGNVIGKVGNTGYSTGPHLHFEIRKKGESKNPLFYIRK